MKELYKRHRPQSLKTMVGHKGVLAGLEKRLAKGDIPQAILFTGPSGTGKTTLARIILGHLGAGSHDTFEINSADFKGIEMVREIRRLVQLSPISGPCRVWIIDEAHQLTKDAQNAFLKILEDTPRNCYFMLATTDPQKLLKTILTRCSEIKLSALSNSELEKLLKRVVEKEKFQIGQDILDEIIASCDGSARKALVILEQVAVFTNEEEQAEALKSTTLNKDLALELARTLVNSRNSGDWLDVAKILKEMTDDPEAVRYLILGFGRAILLKGGKGAERAFRLIDIFSGNFYDSKQAGLAAACWEFINS